MCCIVEDTGLKFIGVYHSTSLMC